YFPWTARVNVSVSNVTAVNVRMRRTDGSTSSIVPKSAIPTQRETERGKADWQHPTGWGLLGSGIGLAVGGVLAVVLPAVLNQRKIDLASRLKIDDDPNNLYIFEITQARAFELNSEAQLWSGIGYGAIGLGSALIIAGAVILAIDAGDEPQDGLSPPGVSFAPAIGPDLFGLDATLKF
ncbi:MAG: hypothetical protein ACI9OJ_000130, partial [Myxococcota bacterium]